MSFRFLEGFQRVFQGQVYRHRSSTQGDRLARLFYEDLYHLNRSSLLKARIENLDCIVNMTNRVTGIKARRGDGTFGEALPNVSGIVESGFAVGTGPTANLQIGIEVKILATAMIKQIDRVISDLKNQSLQFTSRNPASIRIAIVGVNHADSYSSYEGDRIFLKEGSQSPSREAPKAVQRLEQGIEGHFDERLVLSYKATNSEPFPFLWMDESATGREYAACLLRTTRLYESRFP